MALPLGGLCSALSSAKTAIWGPPAPDETRWHDRPAWAEGIRPFEWAPPGQFFLAALAALQPLSIEMALRILDQVAADLRASEAESAPAISIFLAEFSTAPPVVGPLADRWS